MELKECNRDHLIKEENGNDEHMDSAKCIELCSTENECKFAVYNPKPHPKRNTCRTYRSCNRIREAKNEGTIYSKEGKCPRNSFCPSIKDWFSDAKTIYFNRKHLIIVNIDAPCVNDTNCTNDVKEICVNGECIPEGNIF